MIFPVRVVVPLSCTRVPSPATRQAYRCPHGKELTCHARGQINRLRTYDIYHARVADCAACPLRSRCLSKAHTSRRYLSIQVDSQRPNLIDEMKVKIDSEVGKRIYARRLGIVELVVEPVETRSLPTSVYRNGCIPSACAPNIKK
ncbi:MAG: hypothetical protein FJZ86_15890 [Chloroflexi bacterium]|nr:hypothetical protein [Chloroflexota bacterium]